MLRNYCNTYIFDLVMWSLCRSFRLDARSFDDESVVFHHGSGETHHLNKRASGLLNVLSDHREPISEEQLLSRLRQMDSSDFNWDVLPILRQLQSLHIVEAIE